MSDTRIIGLDLLRASAALMVVLAHGGILIYGLWPEQQMLWLLASWGVDLFFVLSGFLIGGILLRSADDGLGWIGSFWMRRWLRTLPNYYLFLAINLLLWRAAMGHWPDFSLHLIFIQNLAWQHPPFFPEAWSLAVEEVFYLLAPLMLALFGVRRHRPLHSAAFLLLALLLAHLLRWQQIAIYEMPWHEGIKKITVARVDAILYGVVIALWVSLRPIGQGLARLLMALAPIPLLLAIWLYAAGDPNLNTTARLWCFTLSGVGFALMLPLFAQLRGSRWPGSLNATIRSMAMWSFALYLVHLPVIRVIDLAGLSRSNWTQALMLVSGYVLISIAIAALVYRFFESPILAWRDRHFPMKHR